MFIMGGGGEVLKINGMRWLMANSDSVQATVDKRNEREREEKQ